MFVGAHFPSRPSPAVRARVSGTHVSRWVERQRVFSVLVLFVRYNYFDL